MASTWDRDGGKKVETKFWSEVVVEPRRDDGRRFPCDREARSGGIARSDLPQGWKKERRKRPRPDGRRKKKRNEDLRLLGLRYTHDRAVALCRPFLLLIASYGSVISCSPSERPLHASSMSQSERTHYFRRSRLRNGKYPCISGQTISEPLHAMLSES